MNDAELMNRASDAVMRIVADLKGRIGLGDEWDAIDFETRKEIKTFWTAIIAHEIAPLLREGNAK